MTRTRRQQQIDRAILQSLADVPEGYLMTTTLLEADAAPLVPGPAPFSSEWAEALRHADTARRVVCIQTEDGPKWKITDAGRAWLAERNA